MENIEEINKIIENLYKEISDIKIQINILKDDIEIVDWGLYALQQKIKKETTAQ